ncbi:MAG: Na/Pi cotransporter family protein [Flavobacteriales bacterium]
MEFGVMDGLKIIGALGFFIYGMKVMSDALQQVAGSKMRQLLRKMTTNRVMGVLTGFMITAILQSSSATTVMTVSFVNAGLLSLLESAGVMMGANIGTTLTGWLVSQIGFEVKVANYALPLIAIAFPFMFANNQNRKKWAEVAIGFALLFMGLDELKHAVPNIKENPEVLEFLHGFSDGGFFTRLMFVGVGTLLTVIVQSSSAAMALTITLTIQGLPMEIAAAMILGENIGTTITAELASIVANVHAKRSARIHSLFNLIGVGWMIVVMPYFLDVLNELLPPPTGGSGAHQYALAAFHTVFNLLNVIICIGFVKFLVELSIKTVKSKGEDDEIFALKHIGTAVFNSPEISIEEATKEVAHFGTIIRRHFQMLPRLFEETDSKNISKLLKRIDKYEGIADDMEVEIANFLSETSREEMSETTSTRSQTLLSIAGELERISDLVYQISKVLERRKKEKIYFLPNHRTNIGLMMDKVSAAIEIMLSNLDKPYANVSYNEAKALEEEINALTESLKKDQLKQVQDNADYNIQTALIYNSLLHSLESVGDHVINVTEVIVVNQ